MQTWMMFSFSFSDLKTLWDCRCHSVSYESVRLVEIWSPSHSTVSRSLLTSVLLKWAKNRKTVTCLKISLSTLTTYESWQLSQGFLKTTCAVWAALAKKQWIQFLVFQIPQLKRLHLEVWYQVWVNLTSKYLFIEEKIQNCWFPLSQRIQHPP